MVIVIESECYLVNGDKFTTLHGEKGVVTILNDRDMPRTHNKAAQIVIMIRSRNLTTSMRSSIRTKMLMLLMTTTILGAKNMGSHQFCDL